MPEGVELAVIKLRIDHRGSRKWTPARPWSQAKRSVSSGPRPRCEIVYWSKPIRFFNTRPPRWLPTGRRGCLAVAGALRGQPAAPDSRRSCRRNERDPLNQSTLATPKAFVNPARAASLLRIASSRELATRCGSNTTRASRRLLMAFITTGECASGLEIAVTSVDGVKASDAPAGLQCRLDLFRKNSQEWVDSRRESSYFDERHRGGKRPPSEMCTIPR